MGGSTPKGKSFEISKHLIVEAWEKVRANGGAPGVDAVSISVFGSDVRNNLYKLWNRMSAGSYLPAPVRAVEIPKDHGAGVRTLGVPVLADRVAQTAVARLLEEKLEPIFHPDSYGYRPGRSAHDALVRTRRRCWKQNWVLDLDIQAFFDSVPHDLLLKAVAHHTDERWVLLYIGRWLTAPMQMPDGTLVAREKGTPQGSPISPLLANLFMHYAFDTWMIREYPGCPFERYAMTLWPTATARNRRGLFRPRSPSDCRPSVCGCTRRRRRSRSARTRTGRGKPSTPASTSSATPSGLVWPEDAGASSQASRPQSVPRRRRRSGRRSGPGTSTVAVGRTCPASPPRSILSCAAGSATTGPSTAPSCTPWHGASI